ncbi:glutamine--fructose-6-phosphate transaminase (isomerizing) [Gelria sp. Kuro-4]|uniref:glutamine--fructose-6-phosphate transaminase (isomerizing) n=1 Tax=Gelria sp. Kuro-4 TaxID=2796927 RepID=UPI001BEE2C74|nr:glutamine--fructose-6-phosphate transaminase (isomerizing) [Gelria sp. Kuro-4]BCV24378.1 glutamine--fructose-6-phosphate aminotransferase [Gelria sp. Kuro-4]
MCGIVGYIGHRKAVPVLIEGLKKLEYRGYDSAGVAAVVDGRIWLEKAVGRLSVVEERLRDKDIPARVGIGHTRWATHGRPSDANAHPHTDCTGRFAVAHNGIIENYADLKAELEEKGHTFKSQTDTEVLAHLLEDLYKGDLVRAVRQMVARLEGSYALAVLAADEPDKVVAVRKDSPLVVGLGRGENFLASDIPAILEHTREVYILQNGDMAVLTAGGVELTDTKGLPIAREVFHVKWDPVQAEKGGYEHFMLKEIFEQPRALRDTMAGRLKNSHVELSEVGIDDESIRALPKAFIVACGTAYHAGLVGKYVLEKLARLPAEVDIASEFRYRDPLLRPEDLVIIISQSGETADTLAALREAKQVGSRILAITNVVGSSVAREADDIIYTWAGPEIAVASTKAYTTQVLALVLLAVRFGLARGTLSAEKAEEITAALRLLPDQVQEILEQAPAIKALAEKVSESEHAFFIGRSIDYGVAMEGALKLKEISYLHAEAYAAGELKHGTLALITRGVPVIALATQPDIYEKMLSNIQEVKAREGHVIAVAHEGDRGITRLADEVFYIPRTVKPASAVLTVIPLQLLAYYAAVARGCDVDKPRNLAKSVTVE